VTEQLPGGSAECWRHRFLIDALAEERRWPDFVPRARARGIESILSTPLVAAERPIGALNVSSETGANIVAVRKQGGTLELRPTKDTLLEESDVIVGLGSPAEIKKLEEMFEPQDFVV